MSTFTTVNSPPTIEIDEISLNIQRVLSVVGAAMLVISISTSGYLYQSFGAEIFERSLYASIGVTLSILGALFLPIAFILWRHSPIISACVFVLWLLALFPAGIVSNWGFMAISNEHRAQAGIPLQLARADLDAAQAVIASMGAYAALNPGELHSQEADAQKRVRDAQRRLDACPANYITRCINPAREQLQAARRELSPITDALANYQRYQGAQAQKREALAKLSTPGSLGASNVHPLFVSQSHVINADPTTTQSGFLAVTAFAFEMLTAIVFLIVAIMRRTQHSNVYASISDADTPMQSESPQNATQSDPGDRKAVGGVYPCGDCGTDYIARAVHQKRCPECRALREAPHKRKKLA